MKNLKISFIATAVVLAAGSAFASDYCNASKSGWQPKEALQQKLEDDGWQVRKIETDDGCYEAYAINAEGQRVEAYFDPGTLELIKSELE